MKGKGREGAPPSESSAPPASPKCFEASRSFESLSPRREALTTFTRRLPPTVAADSHKTAPPTHQPSLLDPFTQLLPPTAALLFTHSHGSSHLRNCLSSFKRLTSPSDPFTACGERCSLFGGVRLNWRRFDVRSSSFFISPCPTAS